MFIRLILGNSLAIVTHEKKTKTYLMKWTQSPDTSVGFEVFIDNF